jgi:hypothetical protein
MELIKKVFERATKVEYSTTGNTKQGYLVPDTGTSYNIKLMLTSNIDDWGFFDTLDDPNATGATGVTISAGTTTITGLSSSRLVELRKWSASSVLSKKYRTSTDPSSDGLNLSLTTEGQTYVYYIGGITYVDEYVTANSAYTTTFSFVSSGYSDTNNFTNLPYIKDEEKQNMAEKPIVGSDVFIIREDLPVFENNYRLRNISNLTELTYYGGGNYFNIVNNT